MMALWNEFLVCTTRSSSSRLSLAVLTSGHIKMHRMHLSEANLGSLCLFLLCQKSWANWKAMLSHTDAFGMWHGTPLTISIRWGYTWTQQISHSDPVFHVALGHKFLTTTTFIAWNHFFFSRFESFQNTEQAWLACPWCLFFMIKSTKHKSSKSTTHRQLVDPLRKPQLKLTYYPTY